jgi:cell division septum initiation protein DivIVA
MLGFNNMLTFYNFETKEMPFVLFQKNEALTDKMKQMRSKTLQVAELKRRSRILEKRTQELTDSTEEQFYVLKQRHLPQEWSSYMEKPIEAIIKEQHSNVTIVIENNRITVNGRTIQIDSSQNNQQQLRGRMIRIAEVMKL